MLFATDMLKTEWLLQKLTNTVIGRGGVSLLFVGIVDMKSHHVTDMAYFTQIFDQLLPSPRERVKVRNKWRSSNLVQH